MSERLQKYLARAGVASRRKAEVMIREGQVTVNGEVARIGTRVAVGDEIRVRGRPVSRPEPAVTYLLHKPAGVITTVTDPQGRATVMGLVPAHPGLHPAGRLDQDSEGLLLLTTDGDLTYRLTHPSQGHQKEYRLWCRDGTMSPERCRRLLAGVALGDGPARALVAEPEPGGGRIVVEEGRNRLVRRMVAALGDSVERLLRVRLAGFLLGDLPPGGYRRLDPDEVRRLGYQAPPGAEENLTAGQQPDRER